MEPKPIAELEEYKAAGKLENKVALITGGDSGIGPVSYTHLTLPTIALLCRSRWSPYH